MRTLFTYLFISTFIFLLASTQGYSQKKLLATHSERLVNGNFQAYDSVHLEYDANDKQTAWWSSYYDKTTDTWKKLLRYEYNYNLNGDILSILVKIWSDTIWKVNSLNTYIYDNGLLQSINISRWYNDKWNNGSITEYFYSTLTVPDSTVYYNFTNNTFQKAAKNAYTYNVDGNLVEDLDYFWDKATSGWVIAIRKSYTYNDKKLNTRIVYSEKAQVGWNILREELMTYDSDNDVRTNDSRDNNGQTTSKRTYIYDKPATSLKELEFETVKIYPSPTSATTFLSWDTKGIFNIAIMNTYGRVIKNFRAITTNAIRFDATTLKNGIYYFTITNTKSGAINTNKFIVSH